MSILNTSFDLNSITKGQLITLTFRNGQKRSGILVDATAQSLSYTYFDELVQEVQNATVGIEQVESGAVNIEIHPHLSSAQSTKKVTGTESDVALSFFESLKNFEGVDTLIRAFKNEDAPTLALIASYLNPQTKTKFLYALPDRLYSAVTNQLEKMNDINSDILGDLEKRLAARFKQAAQKMDERSEQRQSRKTQQTNSENVDIFSDVLGGLLGGNKAADDFLKGINSSVNVSDLLGKLNNKEGQPPLPNPQQIQDMLGDFAQNLPKPLQDIFNNLNPKDEKDENDKNSNKGE